MSQLQEWVDDNGGVVETARILKVDKRTIYFWLERGNIPRTAILLKIAQLSGISIDDLVRECAALSAKSSRAGKCK